MWEQQSEQMYSAEKICHLKYAKILKVPLLVAVLEVHGCLIEKQINSLTSNNIALAGWIVNHLLALLATS